jgi:stage V sporulation protein S
VSANAGGSCVPGGTLSVAATFVSGVSGTLTQRRLAVWRDATIVASRHNVCSVTEFSTMDRFFSKLDLRDIKIKPEGTRFLPTDDDAELEGSAQDTTTDTFEPVPVIVETYEPDAADLDTFQQPAASPEPMNGAALHDEDVVLADSVPYENGEVLKVSAKSRPSAVAGAIAGVVRDAGRAEVQAIGAGATNQAVKAVAIARDYLLESGIDAICVPAFIDVTIDNEERTAIRLVVETR